MRRLIAVLFVVLFASFFSFSAYADDLSSVIKACVTPTSTSTPTLTPTTNNFSVIGKNQQDKPEDFQYRLGESLPIKATGKCAESIEIARNTNQLQPISLYFDDDKIATLDSPPQKLQGSADIQLNFTLARYSDDEDNRKLWDVFFKKKRYFSYMMDVQPAIAIGNDFPIKVASSKSFKFYVEANGFINWTAVICILIFIVAFWGLIYKTNILKDETGFYSLGQTQMTFWLLLVALSFVAINIITGTMERIPDQIFQLMGISIGTGGLAVFMTHSKRNSKLAKLEEEKKELEDKQKIDPASFPAESKTRLDKITGEIKELDEVKVTNRNGFINFCEDICGDSNGASFHRFQVVIWTLVLGGTFVNSVMQIMSMPEFPKDLLILMGVSNVTYLGFKFSEKPK